MKKRKAFAACVVTVLISAVVLSGISGAAMKLKESFSLYDGAGVAAVLLSFSNGDAFAEEKEEETVPEKIARPNASAEKESQPSKTKTSSKSGKAYPVKEVFLRDGNMSYDNISVKNTVGYDLDIEKILSGKLPFEIEKSRKTQVLIYHTHTCESYMEDDSGEYYEDFYPRTTDEAKNVCAVGEKIASALKSRGIGVIHDTTVHDYPSYNGSYDRSFDTVSKYLEKYPDIKITLDIHRDSMTTEDNVKYKPVFEYNGKKAAQIMIMTGYDSEGSDFPFWEDNLAFALKLQRECEDMYEGMTRPLNFGEFTYNMNANNGSLLIEVGTDANSLKEAERCGEMLGEALSSLLQKG